MHHERTVKRKQYLQSFGLQVVTIRQGQWWEWARNNQYEVGVFLKTHFLSKKPITVNELIEKIRLGEMFAVADVEIEVSDHLKLKFSQFPPIFKNCEDGRDDIGEFMKSFASMQDLLKKN